MRKKIDLFLFALGIAYISGIGGLVIADIGESYCEVEKILTGSDAFWIILAFTTPFLIGLFAGLLGEDDD